MREDRGSEDDYLSSLTPDSENKGSREEMQTDLLSRPKKNS